MPETGYLPPEQPLPGLGPDDVDEYGNPIYKPPVVPPHPPAVISPELRRLIGLDGPVAPASVPPSPDMTLAANKAATAADVAKLAGEQPVADQPKWWQRLAAGAMGGMAGYSNATAAGRVRPINIQAATSPILQDYKYPGELADWKNRVAAAQVKATAADQALSDWQKNREDQSQVQLRNAEGQEAAARTGLYNSQADDPTRKDYVPVAGGGLWDAKNQKWIREPVDKSQTIPLDADWAKKNLPALKPDANGQYSIPTAAAGTLVRSSETAPAPKIPGRDVPLPKDVEDQRTRMAKAARPDPNALPSGGTSIARDPALPPNQRDEDLLANTDKGVAAVVKQLVDYKYPLPTSMALRTPYWQNILQLAAEYDPSFDASQYQNRQALRKSFMSGPASQAINALNTVTDHVDRLESNWKDINNMGGAGVALNAPANWVESKLSGNVQKKINTFQLDQDAVSNELMRAWRQVGASDAEVKTWAQKLSPNLSPEAQQGAIQEIYHLIEGKLRALKSQYELGMGKPADFKMLQPAAAKRFTDHGLDVTDLAPGATYGATSQTPNATAPVDPAVKAYADAHFGGDVTKALAAIKQQRGQ